MGCVGLLALNSGTRPRVLPIGWLSDSLALARRNIAIADPRREAVLRQSPREVDESASDRWIPEP